MNANYWGRLRVYGKVLTLFFAANILFHIINKEFLNSQFPEDIRGYLFFFSLGLFLGFYLCNYEIKRVWKKIREDELKATDKDTGTKLKIVKD